MLSPDKIAVQGTISGYLIITESRNRHIKNNAMVRLPHLKNHDGGRANTSLIGSSLSGRDSMLE
jgi:hypothetical protein